MGFRSYFEEDPGSQARGEPAASSGYAGAESGSEFGLFSRARCQNLGPPRCLFDRFFFGWSGKGFLEKRVLNN